MKGSSVNQHLPSAPLDWNEQKGYRTKIQQRSDMNNTKLNESLETILQFAEMSGNKHIEYFYEKENFMSYTILH